MIEKVRGYTVEYTVGAFTVEAKVTRPDGKKPFATARAQFVEDLRWDVYKIIQRDQYGEDSER